MATKFVYEQASMTANNIENKPIIKTAINPIKKDPIFFNIITLLYIYK